MAQNIILKRSAVPGRVPDTGSINLGEVAINTYDGKLYFKKSGSVQSVETIVTTNSITSGSLQVSDDITIQRDLYVVRDVITDGDIDASGSLSGSGLSINDTLNITHNNFQLSGSAALTGSLTVLGAINATQFNINVISSSIIFESGSSKFGNTSDDIHSFTGSVQVSGSQSINGNIYLTGSIIPAGSASFDLGTVSNPFRHLYVGSGSLYIGGNKALSLSDSGQLTIDAQPQADAVIIQGGNLNVYGDIVVHGDNTLLAIRNDSGSNIGAIQSLGTDDIYFEGQHTANSGFQFRNTHPSCSIAGVNYMSIQPNGVNIWPNGMLDIGSWGGGYMHITNSVEISGSSTTIQGVNFNTFSSSLNSRLTTLTNLTSSYATTGSNVFSGSQTITGSVTATSFVGDGSGLTALVVDLSTAQLNDVDGNNIPARSFAELYLACVDAEIVDLDFGI